MGLGSCIDGTKNRTNSSIWSMAVLRSPTDDCRTSGDNELMVPTKDNFSERLNQALTDMGWAARGRASRLRSLLPFEISEKGVKKWLDGDSRPEQDKIAAICAITGCNGEWLLTGIGQMKHPSADQDVLPPSYGLARISRTLTPGPDLSVTLAPVDDGEAVPFPATSPHDYGALITTDGLLPRIERGQVAVVAPELKALSGDMVLITMKDGRQMLCRWLYDSNGARYVESVNGTDRQGLVVDEIDKTHYVAQVLNRFRARD